MTSNSTNSNAGIYKILNLKNNKLYIGSSSNLRYRMSSHWAKLESNCHANIYLQRAYNKYGKENFIILVLEYVDKLDRDLLLEREQYYLDLYQACNNKFGYNIAKSVEGPFKEVLSEEHRRKIGDTLRGKRRGPMSIETKKKISLTKIGKKLSKAHRNKISAGCKKRIIDLNTGKIYPGVVDVVIECNLSGSFIINVCRGRRKSKKYKWAYYIEPEK